MGGLSLPEGSQFPNEDQKPSGCGNHSYTPPAPKKLKRILAGIKQLQDRVDRLEIRLEESRRDIWLSSFFARSFSSGFKIRGHRPSLSKLDGDYD